MTINIFVYSFRIYTVRYRVILMKLNQMNQH